MPEPGELALPAAERWRLAIGLLLGLLALVALEAAAHEAGRALMRWLQAAPLEAPVERDQARELIRRRADRSLQTRERLAELKALRESALRDGKAAFAAGQLSAAAAHFEQALRLVTDDGELVWRLAAVRLAQGRAAEAETLAGRAIVLDGREMPAFTLRSRARCQLGDMVGARADAEHVLRIAPADRPARVALAEACAASGQLLSAIRQWSHLSQGDDPIAARARDELATLIRDLRTQEGSR